jgi:hypothetical protein
VFDQHGWSPDALADMTPYAFAALFIVEAENGPAVTDLGATPDAVRLHNEMHRTAHGLKPEAPSWFLSHLKKR